MRVLIAVHGYPPEYSGGAERRADRTARGLKRRGHEVWVLAAEPAATTIRHSLARSTDPPITRLHVGAAGFRASYDNPQVEQAVADLIDRHKPDLLHVFSGYRVTASAVRAAKRRGIPIVVSLTDYWWFCHRVTLLKTNGALCSGPDVVECARCLAEQSRRYAWPARIAPAITGRLWRSASQVGALKRTVGIDEQSRRVGILRELINTVDVLIAPSQHVANFYVRHGVDPARVKVQRQGVEVAACTMRTKSDVLRFGYLGQIKVHKGVDLLLEAWRMLRGLRRRSLILYGSAAGEPDYERRIRRAIGFAPDVDWPGELVPGRVSEALAALDMVVVPSRWYENSPNVILEAQAVGVPVIGTRLGGIPELVRHQGNGLLFEADNVEDLAAQMQRCLDEPDLISRLGRHPLPFVSVDMEIDRLLVTYAGLLEGSPRPQRP